MKKVLAIFLGMVIFVSVVVVSYVYITLDKIQQSPLLDQLTGKPLTSDDLGITDSAPDEGKTNVINILLFGVDKRSKNESARSDTIMIATIDKKNKTIKLTSLMRDMYLEIPGRGNNRINTAYAFGGPALAIKTVNKNFNLSIQRYVAVDFFAFEQIIDKLNGVEIDVKNMEVRALNSAIVEVNRLDKKYTCPLINSGGLQTLNGRQALAYSRIRKVGRDDFERTERQRKVLNTLYKKVASSSTFDIPGLSSALLPYVETNMTKTEIINLGTSVLSYKISEIDEYRVPADGTFKDSYIRDMAILDIDKKENTRLLHDFIYGR